MYCDKSKVKEVHDKIEYYVSVRNKLETLKNEVENKISILINTLNPKEKDELLFFDTYKLNEVPKIKEF